MENGNSAQAILEPDPKMLLSTSLFKMKAMIISYVTSIFIYLGSADIPKSIILIKGSSHRICRNWEICFFEEQINASHSSDQRV